MYDWTKSRLQAIDYAFFLLMPYFSERAFCSSCGRLLKYAFHPGQKPICQCQNLAMNPLSPLSYFALILQFAQGSVFSVAIVIFMLDRCLCQSMYL